MFRIIKDDAQPAYYWTGTRWTDDPDDAKLYTAIEALEVIARKAGLD